MKYHASVVHFAWYVGIILRNVRRVQFHSCKVYKFIMGISPDSNFPVESLAPRD